MAEFYFTLHAVERFLERHAPTTMTTRDAAIAHLRTQARSAVRLREKTINGQEQWEIQNPYCVLVVKHDPSTKSGHVRQMVCVTVLPESDSRNFSLSEADVEFFTEMAKSNSEIKFRAQETETIQDKAAIEANTRRRHTLRLALIESEERLKRSWHDAVHDFLGDKFVTRPQHENVEVERVHAVAALRQVLSYLVYGGSTREEVLRTVARIDSRYLTESFLNQTKVVETQETIQGDGE